MAMIGLTVSGAIKVERVMPVAPSARIRGVLD
jgi:hypothetical protein